MQTRMQDERCRNERDKSLMHSSNQKEQLGAMDRIVSHLQYMGQTASQPQDPTSGCLASQSSCHPKKLMTGTVSGVR